MNLATVTLGPIRAGDNRPDYPSSSVEPCSRDVAQRLVPSDLGRPGTAGSAPGSEGSTLRRDVGASARGGAAPRSMAALDVDPPMLVAGDGVAEMPDDRHDNADAEQDANNN